MSRGGYRNAAGAATTASRAPPSHHHTSSSFSPLPSSSCNASLKWSALYAPWPRPCSRACLHLLLKPPCRRLLPLLPLLLLTLLLLLPLQADRAHARLSDRSDELIGYRETNLGLDLGSSKDRDPATSAAAEQQQQQLQQPQADGLQQDQGDASVSVLRPSIAPVERLTFNTSYGTITVRLRRDVAPNTVEYFLALVRNGQYSGCSFYRAEPTGPTLDDGAAAPREGYALLQGGAYECGRQESNSLQIEAAPLKRGALILIAGTTEFFFAVGDHPEWDNAFTPFAHVADERSMAVMDAIVKLPTRQEKHPSGTVLRVLLTPVPFSIATLAAAV